MVSVLSSCRYRRRASSGQGRGGGAMIVSTEEENGAFPLALVLQVVTMKSWLF